MPYICPWCGAEAPMRGDQPCKCVHRVKERRELPLNEESGRALARKDVEQKRIEIEEGE